MKKTFTTDEVRIPHSDLVMLRSEGKVDLGVSRTAADTLSTSNLRPKKHPAAAAYRFWQIVAIGLFIYSVYLSFTWAWWSFIVGFAIMALIINANREANQENVLEAAMFDEDFYERASGAGVWMYQMDEADAEAYLTEDMKSGREALRSAGLPYR